MSSERNRPHVVSAGCGGFTLGGVIAAILSWTFNHSIMWAFLHFFCGWFYVIWYLAAHVWHVL